MACVVVVMLSACGNINKGENKDVSSKNKLKIYTTVFAFQSFTEQIGGKYVDVESIYPPGADMHTLNRPKRKWSTLQRVICLFILTKKWIQLLKNRRFY